MTLHRQTKVRQKNANPLVPIDIDLSKAIKISLPKFDFSMDDSPTQDLEEFFEIKSVAISHHRTTSRPKGFKAYKTNDLKILRFVRYSDFISKQHPYIKFDNDSIEYSQVAKEQPLAEYFWRLRESKDHNAYLVSFSSQDITLYDSGLNVLNQYKSSELCEDDYNLRTVELANDLSLFCFTCVSKAYILNKDFEIIVSFQVPHKDDYEKRSKNSEINPSIQKHLTILGLKHPSSQEEVKSTFRKLINKYHPDRNPNSLEAEEKAKELINAYEYLSGQEINTAMDSNNPEEFYWVNKKNSFSTEINGFTIEIQIGSDRHEDWIYGSGFSFDNSMVYLGCYSGKIYETNLDGSVNKIYIIPEDEKCDSGGSTNPISFVYDTKNQKYILSHYYLYVLENDIVINHIKCGIGKIRWFNDGIIKQLDKEIILFDQRGNLVGNIVFKTPVKHLCYNDGLLLVELTTKTITFKIKTTS
ncbi:MAG: DnaJ domain-containing protein [Bacteroidota bacterium]|nr:DnaJ domain-containing protein [Bacteroidota bacterium]